MCWCLSSKAGLSDDLKIDRSWCERLYDERAAGLILYGRALGLSHAEAEDVLHETFVRLLKQKGPPSNPDHYCIRSFRNHVRNHRRSLLRRIGRELESHRWFEKAPEESGRERAAMRSLAELPVPQREVIVLKIWHKYTYEEIGQILSLSPNTAAGRYRYGLHRLRTILNGIAHEETASSGESIEFLDASPSFPSP